MDANHRGGFVKAMIRLMTLLAACQTGLAAAATATVSFGTPEFQLADHNLADGIDPGIDFTNARSDVVSGGSGSETSREETFSGMLLSPHTRVTLNLPARVQVEGGASAIASLFMGDEMYGIGFLLDPSDTAPRDRTATLVTSFENLSNQWVDLEYRTHWLIRLPTAPIPEPSTYMLMVAGLGVLVLLRQKAKPQVLKRGLCVLTISRIGLT
jgi:hypothetical protein